MKVRVFSVTWLLAVLGSTVLETSIAFAREEPAAYNPEGTPSAPVGAPAEEVSPAFILGPDAIPNAAKIDFFDASDFLIRQTIPPRLPGGLLTARELGTTPVLAAIRDGGVGTGLVELEPCGTLAPHLHPGATENHFVIEGEITVSFVTELPFTKPVMGNITRLESFQVPQGLIHWVQNSSCDKKALYTVAFGNDPGAVLVGTSLAVIPAPVLSAMLPDFTEAEILKLQASASQASSRLATALQGPLISVSTICQKACGLL